MEIVSIAWWRGTALLDKDDTIQIKLKENGSILAQTPVFDLEDAQAGDNAFEIEIDFTIRSIGATGSIATNFDFTYNKTGVDSKDFRGTRAMDVQTIEYNSIFYPRCHGSISYECDAKHSTNKIVPLTKSILDFFFYFNFFFINVIYKKHKQTEMSLNKFTSVDTGYDLKLDVGCDELKCNSLEVGGGAVG